MGRIAGRFARVEPRRRAGRLVLGLLSDLPRKNCWTIAEWAGETTPDGMQHLLCRADLGRRRRSATTCATTWWSICTTTQAVLVVDETGDVKKGTRTVGVQRQYTGTAGRIENSQVAVYLVYAGGAGTPRWTGNCTFRAPGPPTRTAAGRPGSARTPSSRPSRSWPPA